MKIVTWNLAHRSHQDRTWDYLCNTVKPDIAFLQEANPPSWVPSDAIVFVKTARDWSTAIYAPSLPLSRILFQSHPSCVATASMIVRNAPILLASIHAPTQPSVFPRLQDIFQNLETMEYANHAVVGGDLNSCRHAEKVWPKCGHETFWQRIDKGDLWVDCCRKFHSDELQTFFREGTINKFQDDHIFVSRGLSECIRSCDPLDNPNVRSMSDHIPLIAELDLQ
jgi:endonuclease/exonuclease/phosphatase family metal-dependent hydrolase